VSETKKPTRIFECGCCGAWHRDSFWGDCRNDTERFIDPEDFGTRSGETWVEVDPETGDVGQESL